MILMTIYLEVIVQQIYKSHISLYSSVDGSPWEPSSRSRICSQHFVGGEKSEHPCSPAYLPTIFPEEYYGKQKHSEAALLRAQNRYRKLNLQFAKGKNTFYTYFSIIGSREQCRGAEILTTPRIKTFSSSQI
ncbi:PREDICTED: uncharacterized protein LOC105571173 [Vollenhovia emeryi]|uniref:uncharacterized protein LOC105571173 n=1 Tax=Vollenhovia emeryi TaxID=411798 RepID=UPI0005F5508C|nr:PREDICTED: uncharacterized protein LOC105571173 [Vollenhovia emeryi]